MATVATISTLSAILKEFYLGPIAEQLNQEIMVYELFDKASVDWSGRRVVIPVHLARNTGVGFAAEDGALPLTGTQTYGRLEVDAKYLYGRFEITGPAMAAAKSGGNAFISYVDAEMTKLTSDVKIAANEAAVHGGQVLGYVWQKQNVAAPAGATFQYSGRTKGLAVAGAATTAQLVQLDTYAAVGAATVVNSVTDNTIIFAAAINTSGVDPGIVMAVTAPAASTLIGNVANGWQAEPNGMTSNLSSPSHFTIDRSAAINAELRSNHLVQSPATDVYAALTLDRLQATLDQILVASSEAPDCIIMNPVMRQEYTSLLVGSSAGNLYVTTDSAKNGDGGFTGLAYGNIPMKTSQSMFKGTFFFLTTKSWCVTELEGPGFADEDGDVLSRVLNKDSFEGFYKMYYNTVCKRPNANAVLTGVSF